MLGPLVILWLLGSSLFGSSQLAFRDVSHFYTPLYEAIARRNSTELIPLWNPLCQTGMPLMGETTTAVLYPVRYLVSSIAPSITWYVALHLMWASIAAALAARWWRCSWRGQTIASLVYPLSGSVYFLHTNPPFLVSASWLPLVMAGLMGAVPFSLGKRIAIVGIALAMMVMGGDPQTALHCVLIALLFSVCTTGARRIRNVKVLAASACLAAMIAAPQIAASWSWSRQSDRTHQVSNEASWFSPPAIGGRKHASMEYSVPPWHFAELMTSSAFGSLVPVNGRLSAMIPGDGRMWTPTLFMGSLVVWMVVDRIVLFFDRLFHRRKRRRRSSNALFAVAAISSMLAMGHFGLAWWFQSATGQLRGVDSAAMGPYWMLYHLLPGYDAFRYPAKWLPMFAWALAMATAIWVDKRRYLRAKTSLVIVGVVVVGMMLATLFVRQGNAGAISDEYWGPLDVAAGLRQVRWSLLGSAAVVAAFAIALWLKRSSLSLRVTPWVLIGISVVELSWSAGRITHQADDRPMVLAGVQSEAESPLRLMRVSSGDPWPTTSSADRLSEVHAAERSCRFGRWHMADDLAVFNNFVSIGSNRQRQFWQSIRELEREQGGTLSAEAWERIRAWLAIDGVIKLSEGEASIELDDQPSPPIQVVTTWRASPKDSTDQNQFAKRIGEVVSGRDLGPLVSSDQVLQSSDSRGQLSSRVPDVGRMELCDIRQSAAMPYVAKLHTAYLKTKLTPNSSIAGEVNIEVRSSTAQTLDVDVKTQSPIRLVRPVYQDGHWVATMGGREVDVEVTDFLKQSVAVGPGEWRVRFEYRPWWLWPSIAISGIGVAIAVGVCFYRPRSSLA